MRCGATYHDSRSLHQNDDRTSSLSSLQESESTTPINMMGSSFTPVRMKTVISWSDEDHGDGPKDRSTSTHDRREDEDGARPTRERRWALQDNRRGSDRGRRGKTCLVFSAQCKKKRTLYLGVLVAAGRTIFGVVGRHPELHGVRNGKIRRHLSCK